MNGGVLNPSARIKPEQSYPGTAVLELVKAAEEEIEAAVNEAYAEGYKAAMLRYAPEIAALRIKESALQTELERERQKNRFFWPVTAGSFVSGFLIHSLLPRQRGLSSSV
jgi:formate dehydrogenase maturation protein FdhE